MKKFNKSKTQSSIYHKYKTKKKFGQHFITNKKIIDNIITLVNPQYEQAMIEIGPGLGALTEVISIYSSNIIVIEIDKTLIKFLKKNINLHSKIKIIHQDATKINFTLLAIKLGKPIRIFGNLPYNISTILIMHLMKHIHAIHDMHFMIQKEVANRLAAKPNTKIYGRTSILIQYFCKVFFLLKVPSIDFYPIPKVESIFIKLTPHIILPYTVINLRNLLNIVKLAFNQRRKLLYNSLNKISKKIINLNNISFNKRAENLSIKEFCDLANLLSKNKFNI